MAAYNLFLVLWTRGAGLHDRRREIRTCRLTRVSGQQLLPNA